MDLLPKFISVAEAASTDWPIYIEMLRKLEHDLKYVSAAARLTGPDKTILTNTKADTKQVFGLQGLCPGKT